MSVTMGNNPVSTEVKTVGHVCPQCQHQDRILKVSGIVSGQTTRQSGSATTFSDAQRSYSSYSSSTARSELAQKLTPPAEKSIIEVAAPLVLGAGRIAAGFSMIILGLIAWAIFGLAESAWGLLPLLGAVFLGWVAFSKNQKSPEEIETERRKQRQWQAAMNRWHMSFYCSRCDVVFVEDEGRYTSPDNFYRLLYS